MTEEGNNTLRVVFLKLSRLIHELTRALFTQGTQRKLDTRVTSDTQMKSADQSERGMMIRITTVTDCIVIQTPSISEDVKCLKEVLTLIHTCQKEIIAIVRYIGEKVWCARGLHASNSAFKLMRPLALLFCFVMDYFVYSLPLRSVRRPIPPTGACIRQITTAARSFRRLGPTT
jgi:hypothetical protein